MRSRLKTASPRSHVKPERHRVAVGSLAIAIEERVGLPRDECLVVAARAVVVAAVVAAHEHLGRPCAAARRVPELAHAARLERHVRERAPLHRADRRIAAPHARRPRGRGDRAGAAAAARWSSPCAVATTSRSRAPASAATTAFPPARPRAARARRPGRVQSRPASVASHSRPGSAVIRSGCAPGGSTRRSTRHSPAALRTASDRCSTTSSSPAALVATIDRTLLALRRARQRHAARALLGASRSRARRRSRPTPRSRRARPARDRHAPRLPERQARHAPPQRGIAR